MEWDDDGIVLAVRRHGETGAVASLLTRSHGRHAGLVHGGQGRTNRPILQPGNLVRAKWTGRLPEQLGNFKLEMLHAYGAAFLDDAARLSALGSACALVETALAERQPHPACHAALVALLHALEAESWPSIYVHFELALLRDLGFGLDLSACAATGQTDDLAWVSPKTGRAVSRAAGEPYRDKLFKLPAFLVEGGEGDAAAIREGLEMTGFFLQRHVLDSRHAVLPAARGRMIGRLG
ncbi:DNA recombination and repair protein RecO [Paramagnetospirillum magnetotacticum MS-1]|uniref:DNA repair protein RecO n=1 Tax=Paramagnetospirillum magnetotacticum MS-1 TaxID=272627 RepID=A0A0C2YUD3_PARME|nr:DNA repair protein RecO [Paramagnetospirillum magnetotacticum]KIL98733.1 DNA recombination and repair protein RecO [Paramagnetospirillum magnetotacticum MS-1]